MPFVDVNLTKSQGNGIDICMMSVCASVLFLPHQLGEMLHRTSEKWQHILMLIEQKIVVCRISGDKKGKRTYPNAGELGTAHRCEAHLSYL